MRTSFVIAPAVLFLYAFRRFYLGSCALNASITSYLAFQACFMCFLYILPRLRKNAFKRVLQRYIRIGFGSGCVWRWLYTSTAVPGLLPGHPRRAVLLALYLALVLPDHAGRRGFIGFLWRSAPDRLEVSGRDKGTKEMYDKSETASKPGRFELGKSEKNRRNLRLIQTCDFFILCILYINSYNVPRRDVNFISLRSIRLFQWYSFFL